MQERYVYRGKVSGTRVLCLNRQCMRSVCFPSTSRTSGVQSSRCFGACDELVAYLLLIVANFEAFGQCIHVGIEPGPVKHCRGYRKS